MENVHAARIRQLRLMMKEYRWDAVVISSSDPHGSEYPAPRWKQVQWMSGFTGEAGDLVVTQDHAGLWTDSRYFIQAVSQLEGTGVVLHKTRMPDSVSIPQWLSERVDIVAVDGKSLPLGYIKDISVAMESTHQSQERDWRIIDVPDMLDRIWNDRPWVPVSRVTTLDDSDVGESRSEKIVWLRKFLMKEDLDAILLSSLDEIAWVLNVRGEDIEYNPLVISYLLVTMDECFWFVRKNHGGMYPDTSDSFNELKADGISIMDYDDVAVILSEMPGDMRVFVDAGTLNYSIYKCLQGNYGENNLIEGISPVSLRKAVKNPVEIERMKEAYIEDGAAVETFLYWLETGLSAGQKITEWEASEKLTSIRSGIPGYRGNSFENISAYGANAALPHYSTPQTGSALIEPKGLYLTDSGGQYLFGTTDITRTVPVGVCSDLEKEDYTLVLKGMIDLSMAVFPEGTAGCQLDVLARNPMWRSKRNFGHGTGHGVGFFLCVHEGPQDIRQNFNRQPILPGMVTSDEPGIYREGMHGIRHENILLCRASGTNDFGKWLCFETLTCCHIDTSVIIKHLLSADEIAWLDSYNECVYRTLCRRLPSEVAAWLREKTLPLAMKN